MGARLPRVGGVLGKPEEAVQSFRKRAPVTKETWDALDARAREHAFTVAGTARLDVISEVWRSLETALAEGVTFEEWKAGIGPTLEAAWAGSVANPGARLATIFRTNAQVAYSAGRYQVATDPVVMKLRPVWLYDATLDGRTTSTCESRDGVQKDANDPWWATNHPPLHHNCRSTVITLRRSQAAAMPKKDVPLDVEPAAPGFGRAPSIGDWRPNPNDYPAPLWLAFNAAE